MAENKPKGQPVKLTVTSCVVGYQGKNSRGDDYTIYEIAACRETGEPITDKKLRSFEELPVGELLELLVVPFQSEKHGLSFTLSRKNKVGAHQRINSLTETVNGLVQRLEVVERWIGQQAQRGVGESPIPTHLRQEPQPVAAAPAPAQDPQRQADLDERFGADPPF